MFTIVVQPHGQVQQRRRLSFFSSLAQTSPQNGQSSIVRSSAEFSTPWDRRTRRIAAALFRHYDDSYITPMRGWPWTLPLRRYFQRRLFNVCDYHNGNAIVLPRFPRCIHIIVLCGHSLLPSPKNGIFFHLKLEQSRPATLPEIAP